MLVLGIESTAHTFAASVVRDSGEVLSNISKPYSSETGGMLPAQVADFHVNNCEAVLDSAVREAGVRMCDIGLVAFSQGPGIGHMLRVGAIAARTLSLRWDIPIMGVNHCIAHLEIGQMLFDVSDPVLLYVSGANTQVIAYEGGRYRIFGETLDMGVGNFLDNVARLMGLGFPGGPRVHELAQSGSSYIELPYSVKGMDMSFGGLLTNVKQKIQKGTYSYADLAYSVEETVFAMLTEVSERALAHCGKGDLLLGGGVACNERLQEMARIMCDERKARCYVPERQYLVDNAAMIAWSGLLRYRRGSRMQIADTAINPYERTDEVTV